MIEFEVLAWRKAPVPQVKIKAWKFSDTFDRYNPWYSIDSAPKDQPIEIYVIDPVCPHHSKEKYPNCDLLPDFETITTWHPDAGFCVDELRVPILWRDLL